jgi:tetratricopeptide (TPR) repeat protein
MLELPDVTIACIDTANHALALRALERSLRGVRFARALFLTDTIPGDMTVPGRIDTVRIEALASRDDYSRFVLKSLHAHVDTPHVLVIQWDGYVVNPQAFDPAFLDCDYVGAKWFWFDDAMRVGNGGFSLRSRRLLQALQDPRIELVDAEDITIGRAFRPLLEREYGIRYGTEALADRFAFEAAYPVGLPFGFHGLYNFCRVVPPAELAALAPRFSDAIAASLQLGQLLRNCIALAQWDAAAALARRRLAARSDDSEARALLARAEAGLASGPVVGRNDPCPCGSGKRYKQCHGALGRRPATSTGSAAASTPAPTGGPAPSATSASSATALAQQGVAAHQRGDIDAAERAYRAALERQPEHPLALHYLGVVLHQRGGHADALPLLERSAAYVPQEPEFHNNLGLTLAALDRNDDAIAAYRRALDRKPGHATAWNNLGLALQAQNLVPDAIAAFRRAIALVPQFAQAHWNLALALLASGDYAEGWREYEWRLRLPELGGRSPALPITRWQGEALGEKTLLVTAEQGIGDAIQFVRFASTLAERGVRIVVQAAPELQPLLATASGVAATVSVGDPLPPACDAEIPLLSLPYRLGARPEDSRVPQRYLRSDASRRHEVEGALAIARSGTRRIGLAWAGSPQHRNDARRSIPLALLAPLLSIPGITWYSLQKGTEARQSERVAEAKSVVPLDPKSDFGCTAALVDALDAVVSVDTSIAHLAGALGKPTFVLLPFAPDWRWGIAGTRTPWYPTMTLHRQRTIGDWPSAIAPLLDTLTTPARAGPA